MRIAALTFSKNEEDLIGWYLRHYNFCDDIFVYDGHSEDGTVEKLKLVSIMNSNAHTYLIQEDFDGVELKEPELTGKRNSYFFQNHPFQDYDWVIIGDVDEFVYHPEGVRRRLYYEQSIGTNIIRLKGYDMYHPFLPDDDGSNRLTDHCKTGILNEFFQSKYLIFNPREVHPNWNTGCHNGNPHPHDMCEGKLVWNNYGKDGWKCLHYRYLGYDYLMKKCRYAHSRLSKNTKAKGLANHYDHLIRTLEPEDFDRRLKKAVRVIE